LLAADLFPMIFSLACLLTVCVLGFAGAIIKYRATQIVKSSSLVFSLLILLGGAGSRLAFLHRPKLIYFLSCITALVTTWCSMLFVLKPKSDAACKCVIVLI
jgi:hypothetical protein